MNARPAGVPPAAVWSESDDEWELGERRGDLHVGEWTWWRADGSLVCRSTFDDAGRLDGLCRRYHPGGEVALEAPYSRGVLHGRQVMTRPSTGASPENTILLQLEDVYRMDTLHVSGVA
jgi:hypothetical protein